MMRLPAYYDVLNEQPEFLEALEQLRFATLAWLRRPDVSFTEWDQRLGADEEGTTRRGELLREFAEKWWLPRWRGEATEPGYRLPKNAGTFDMWYSLALARAGEPLRLYQNRAYWRPDLVSPATDTDEYPPRIYPMHPEPFVYDPYNDRPAWARDGPRGSPMRFVWTSNARLRS
jgi:hypothetical protein